MIGVKDKLYNLQGRLIAIFGNGVREWGQALIINYFLSDTFFEPFSINPWVNSQSKISWQLE